MRKPRRNRGVGMLAAVLIGVGLVPAAGPAALAKEPKIITPPRDWTKAPAIVQVDTAHDVYALGDIHGDYDRLVTLLVASKVIAAAPSSPTAAQWTAGNATLVCTGDVIDKDDHALKVIPLLQTIKAAAPAAGGQVIVTMGNHEAEFLADPDGKKEDKKAEDFLAELAGVTPQPITPDQVAAGTDPLNLGQFFLAMPIAARVNDWFFCHAGNTKNLSIPALTTALQAAIDADGYAAPFVATCDSLLEARMHPHPWWEVPGNTPAQDQAALAGVVKALGVNHLVFGHQPGKFTFSDGTTREKGTLTQKFGGLVFMIDVGMSSGIDDSKGSLMRIHKGGTVATVIDHNGKESTIWTKP